MEVKVEKDNGLLNVIVVGRLDTNTAPDLESIVNENKSDVTTIKLDFTNLDYISSAGLRVVLVFHKSMAAIGGKLIISNPKEEVMDVFDMTGFSSFLCIEEK